ncbi:type II toxin-antitoxin system HipA family toxin [Thiohalophilus sp.]|uniref:type II toxin-antitoxin system HipA family toxin n=1 Tax=Thiohalophilus sp. TaxID=3028392 RepID=UPI002ACDD261|nr:HipA domain-containing protein [Thiohalophilus sp.]MDZ7661645.1 HipA domain-containing protein [Thiohalophilus sp.]
MANVTVLDVLLHGRQIGTLTQIGHDRNLFAFTEEYINDTSRPTLSLSFKDQLGNLITDIKPRQVQVPPFFSNLLPEGHMRDYLAERAGVNSKREFFLLWVLGRDLPGSIVVQPADGEAWPDDDIEDEARSAHGHEQALRFSLAGVQIKFSAVMSATGGLTIPAQGVGGSWIIKLPSAKYDDVPENEFSMMSLAAELGMDIPEIALHPTEQIDNLPEGMGNIGGQALAIKRFDRTEDDIAIHIEDFAQVFDIYPDNKYKKANYRNIAQVIWAEIGEPGIIEFVRRLVFNTLIGNADMHLKNWSLIYPDGRTPALAPGYDFVSTIPYLPDVTMALKYSRTKSMTELSVDELSHFSARAQLPKTLVINAARKTVQDFLDIWPKRKAELPLSAETINTIDKHVKSIALVEELQ